MNYLLDTNVISEVVKPNANQSVIEFLSSIPSSQMALSVITLGEIRKGVEKLQDNKKKQRLIKWLEIDLVNQFQNRIITINEKVADKWGYLTANYPNLPAIDGLIAASALTYNLKIVTRNIKDFNFISNLEVINPWDL